MEQFAKLPRWGQLLVTLLLGGLIVVAAWFWPISGQQDKLQSQLAERDRLDGEIRQGREAQRRVDELNRQIELILRDLEVLKSIIPTDPETGKLLRVFQSYARDQNLDIRKISPKAIEKKDLYSQQAYQMDVNGGYHDLALFFDKIAHMRRIVNITDLVMKSGAAKGGYTVSASFKALVYMQNPEAFQTMEKKP